MASADRPSTRRERADAAANRSRILDAAAYLFASVDDPQAVTMGQIAAAAGVGRATLYRRYESVADVAAALLDEQERDIQARMVGGPPPLGPGAAPAERMCALYDELLALLEVHHGLVLGAESGAARLGTASYAGWRTHVLVLLGEAGYPRTQAEPLADILLAPLSAETYRYQRFERGFSRQRIADALHRVARAILAPDRDAP